MTDAEVLVDNVTSTAPPEILTDTDVIAIQEQIKDASGAVNLVVNSGESSLYYDASTMAPLNPFAAVSQSV